MKTIKNIQSLVAFENVARLKSFSNAAKELGVSKAHVSKLIQKLEDQLGQRLLNRSTRSVTLTKVGESFYQACTTSFYNILKAQESVLEQSNAPSGKLKISVAGIFGEEYVAPFIRSFLKKYPKIEIELIFEEKLVNLLTGDYDFAIRVGKLNDSSLISKQIASRQEYICASPRYLHLNGTPKKPEDLKYHNCLSPKQSWNILVDKKECSVNISGNLLCNNARVLTQAALDDLGVVYLPGEYVKSYIDEGQLTPLLKSYIPQEVPIWLLTPTKKNMSQGARAFLKEISNANLN